MQPINYLLPQSNPLAEFSQGFDVANGVRQVFQQRQEYAQAQAAAQAKAERQAAYQQAAQSAFMTGDPGQFIALQAQFPEFSEQAQSIYKSTDAVRRDVEFRHYGQVVSALKSGKPDIAKQIAQERLEAAKNAGEDTSEEEEVLASIDRDANVTASQLQFLMSMADPAAFKTLSEGLGKAGDEMRAQELQAPALAKATAEASSAGTDAKFAERNAFADLAQKGAALGLTRAQTNKAIVETRKVGVEIAAANLELAAAKKNGGIAPAKAFEQEEKLRKEYESRTRGYNDARTQFSAIAASAKDGSGAGDIALVTAFNKMLDPGSVVRETEFANSRDTAGVLTKLSNAAQKLQKGSFLDPDQRKEFVKLAGEYYKAAESKEKYDRATIGTVVKNYSLNEANVFGPARENLNPGAPPKPVLPSEGGGNRPPIDAFFR